MRSRTSGSRRRCSPAGAILSHGAGRPVGRAFARRLAVLFGATRGLLARGGGVPQIGDADAPRVLALRDRAPADAGNLLPLGAALLNDASLLAGRGPGDAADVAWLLGPRALAGLAAARAGRRPRSASFAAAGLHVLRRGPFEVFMSCGPNGQRGVGGHSHNDKLALEVRAHGALAVCDGGTPSTGSDPEVRDAFRSTRAHATVVVDGLEQAPLLRDRPGALPDVAAARLLAFEPGGPADRLVGRAPRLRARGRRPHARGPRRRGGGGGAWTASPAPGRTGWSCAGRSRARARAGVPRDRGGRGRARPARRAPPGCRSRSIARTRSRCPSAGAASSWRSPSPPGSCRRSLPGCGRPGTASSSHGSVALVAGDPPLSRDARDAARGDRPAGVSARGGGPVRAVLSHGECSPPSSPSSSPRSRWPRPPRRRPPPFPRTSAGRSSPRCRRSCRAPPSGSG